MKIYVNGLRKVLFSAISEAKESIRIMSPFLSAGTVGLLCEDVLKGRAISCTVITRLPGRKNTITKLMEAGVSVHVEDKLHTKLYIIDDKTVLLGSANFTKIGLEENYEILIQLNDSDNPAEVKRLVEYIQEWEQDERSLLTYERIQQWEAEGKDIEVEIHDSAEKDDPNGKFYSRNRRKPKTYQTDAKPTVWLKLVGTSKDIEKRRKESKEPYHVPQCKSLDVRYLSFPQGQPPAGMKKGDIIYIAFLGADENKKKEIYIVARAISAGFDRSQPYSDIIRRDNEEQFLKWPIYMELEEAKVFQGKINEALTLSKLWSEMGLPSNKPLRGSHARVLQKEGITFLEEYAKQFR